MKLFYLILIPFLLFAQNTHSIYFDGGDYMTETILNYRATDDNGAISAWINLDGSASYGIVFNKSRNDATTTYAIFGVTASEQVYISQRNADTADGLEGTNVISTGSWHHCVWQPNAAANGYEFYFDGVLKTVGNGGLSVTSGSDTGDWMNSVVSCQIIAIGALIRTTVAFQFTGYIDEVAYFSSSLTQAQITAIYNNGTPNDISGISGLVDWWRFEEGTGTTTSDQDANNTFTFAAASAAPTWSTTTPGWDSGDDGQDKGFKERKSRKVRLQRIPTRRN